MATQSQRAQSAIKLANHNARYNLLPNIIGTVGTEHSVSGSNDCNSHVHGYGKKAYILKYR